MRPKSMQLGTGLEKAEPGLLQPQHYEPFACLRSCRVQSLTGDATDPVAIGATLAVVVVISCLGRRRLSSFSTPVMAGMG
jgi:hypothetical protein